MRILGLDVGSKRIGFAVSDELGIIAQPLKTFEHKNDKDAIEEIKRVSSELNVKEIVIGLPLNMDGTESRQTQEVVKFMNLLEKELSLPIKTWDERLTTVGAEKALLEADVSRKKRKFVKDKIAAQLMLQNYLDYTESKEKDNA